ncbi:MAG: response regulator [Chlamydiia bacterium]|nr:response regulator [Chlamydiia bacterium]
MNTQAPFQYPDGRPLYIGPESDASEHLLDIMRELARKQLANLEHRHILVVEDNENNSALIEDILDSIHMQCHVVTNARDAIEHCRDNTPLMILMDIGLPEVDGLQLTAHLRDWPSLHNVPVIAVTAHSGDRMQARASAAGCNDFLAKPFVPKQLIEIVDRYSDMQPV